MCIIPVYPAFNEPVRQFFSYISLHVTTLYQGERDREREQERERERESMLESVILGMTSLLAM